MMTPQLAAVLDLPKGSSLILNACAIRLQRDDFVGFVGFPDQGPYFLAIRAAVRQGEGFSYSSIAVGFWFSASPHLILQYDEATEEVSSKHADEFTQTNLLRQLGNNEINPNRILSFDQVVSGGKQMSWKKLTSCITTDFLRERGVHIGQKITPGSYQEPTTTSTTASTKDDARGQVARADGAGAVFPRNIPVIDSKSMLLQSSQTRITSHAGTKAFIAQLQSSERTSLFMSESPGSVAFEIAFRTIYHERREYILGDLQLAYILFMQLNCYNSLEHWRDVLSMLSMVDPATILRHQMLYQGLMETLEEQIVALDSDFLEDEEFSGGNFLVPSLQRLLHNLQKTGDAQLCSSSQSFHAKFKAKCPTIDLDMENENIGDPASPVQNTVHSKVEMDLVDDDDDKYYEDGPVVVDMSEVEESLNRTSQADERMKLTSTQQNYDLALRTQFPILFSAMLPHEDVLMTCARALDEAKDVSLVREAADYLDEIESRK